MKEPTTLLTSTIPGKSEFVSNLRVIVDGIKITNNLNKNLPIIFTYNGYELEIEIGDKDEKILQSSK